MQLLCLGDVAICEEISSPWPHPFGNQGEDDLRVLLNWELPLGNTKNSIPRTSGPRLLSHSKSVYVIKKWTPGFVALATNHILDAGEEGLLATIATLKETGFQTVGAGRYLDEIKTPLLWETNEGRLAIINWIFPETHPDWSSIPGPNCWPGLKTAERIIQDLRNQVDWVMIFAHWSDELFPYPRSEDRRIARELADIGADFVIGHHPHVVRGMEIFNACPVFYSLGNYYFSDLPDDQGGWISREAPRNRESLGIQIFFRKGEKPEYQILSFWRKGSRVVIDPLRRATRRMKLVSRPLQQLQNSRYLNWYSIRRASFNRWEYRLYFRYWQLGIPGVYKILIQQILK